jgi:hypothetical protein
LELTPLGSQTFERFKNKIYGLEAVEVFGKTFSHKIGGVAFLTTLLSGISHNLWPLENFQVLIWLLVVTPCWLRCVSHCTYLVLA